jgi:protein-S-isoprenylcysteine O-methyltransferase Ste14
MTSARISLIGLVAAVLALARLCYTGRIFGTEPISIGVQILAALLMLWARLTFGTRSFHAAANPTEGELVTHGPYAHVRNPIYAAAILFTWAGIAVHLDVETVLLGLVITGGMLVRIFSEEKLLHEVYGKDYDAYTRRVKRLVPFVF